MSYKVIITPRQLCDEAMKTLASQAEYRIVEKVDACNFLSELQWADALMLKEGNIKREDMVGCPNLKVIARHGVGFDTVDVKSAAELGIPVVITPGANARSVAEHTVAMILALTKNMIVCHNETVRGNWDIRQEFRSFEFEGKLVGLIGVGNIGRMVAKMCIGLGFQVEAYDPFVPTSKLEEAGYKSCHTMEEVLSTADIVSVHVPYNEQTKNLISTSQLNMMKPDAILVNCARGGIVNEDDLAQALWDGVIGGAGLDVFVGEKLATDSPLAKAPHLICTPHMAAQTSRAVEQICTMMITGMMTILHGQKWPFVADRSVYDHPYWKDRPWASL
ncbi:D-3-phosphoglycerate dehydrogenase [uncultured Clostridium sp.]|uniref:hydroxyacid dehydrogenase n=1 Tax=Flintibacter sp. HCN-6482 TaxID=3134672 RepID=UPI000821B1D5|nr:D-3-phosphoglycerate dehydrogenase [uncultured Clostridium sp.]